MRNRIFFLTAILMAISPKMNAQDEIQKLKEYIAGSQLVIYSESSYVTDNSASAITYVNFCSDGRYHYDYEGSYTVKGTQNTTNRDNRAYGAGKAANSGDWDVLEYEKAYYLEITDPSNAKTYYPIDIQKMIAGKWKQGNVTYVFAPNHGVCDGN
ncbi:hypothetical protein [Spongiimicrobium sp. 2-473A-2-J]|uniref:hypothetical protein n=1 Tax=Eudoraea algarum TaxID=3417568 RepID=UPI003D3636CE